MATQRITLLTDFGTADGYVGAMKGVIASIAPSVLIDDITHDIPPGDVKAGAWCLGAYWRLYPEGTVHICVVDPGVGSARRSLAAELRGQRFIAPDNGLLTDVLCEADATAVEIADRRYMRSDVSSTFHGRDIFAVAGAHVAAGTPIGSLGVRVRDPVLLEAPAPIADARGVRGEVVHVDRFGNLITNIRGEEVRGAEGRVHFATGVQARIVRTYSDAQPGELIALIGSSGVLELAVRNGSAAGHLGAGRGQRIVYVRGRADPPRAPHDPGEHHD